MLRRIMSFRFLTASLVYVITVFMFAGFAAAQQKPKLRPLRIALPNTTATATSIYVAKDLGIFETHGLDAEISVLAPRAALAALLSGELDFYGAIGSTGRAALRGLAVRVVLVALNRPDFALVATKEIESIEQLRGKVIGGYTAQGTVNVVLDELLRRKGLKPDEYKIINAGTARAAALLSGTVPAALLNSVETVRLQKQGFRVLARAADEMEIPQSGLGTSVAALQTKRDFLRSALQAALEAVRITATQKEKVVPVLVKRLALTPDEASFVYDALQPAWAMDGKPTPAAWKFDAELSQRDMGLKEPPKPEQVYDFSLLDELGKNR